MILTQLEEFRQAIYDCLGKAKDAVFELMDAVSKTHQLTICQILIVLSELPLTIN
jgi:hypothetical protein